MSRIHAEEPQSSSRMSTTELVFNKVRNTASTDTWIANTDDYKFVIEGDNKWFQMSAYRYAGPLAAQAGQLTGWIRLATPDTWFASRYTAKGAATRIYADLMKSRIPTDGGEST